LDTNAKALEVKKMAKPKRSYPWSDEEIFILEEHYRQNSLKAMCKMLPGRTLVSIRDKATTLGLRDNPSYRKADPHTMQVERDLITGELRFLIMVTCKTKEAAAKAIQNLEDAISWHDLSWWWIRKDMKLGELLEQFIDGYSWKRTKAFLPSVTDSLELAVKSGEFEQPIDFMIYGGSPI
jgi:hypothetical protein